MAVTWFRSRKLGRHAPGYAAASAADLAQPKGRHTVPGAPGEAAEGQTAACRKCRLPITLLGGTWTCTGGPMYGEINCVADLSAPYTAHEPAVPGETLDYDASYDHPGWDDQDAERELLMRSPAPAAAFPGVLETGPFPSVTPNSGRPAEDFRRPAAPAPAGTSGLDEPTATFRPDFAETGNRERPYAPGNDGPPAAITQPADAATGHMLAILGSVCLGTDPLGERLPYFAGTRTDGGRRLVGVTLGSGTKAWEVFETWRIDVLDALEAAVRQARDTLVYGSLRDTAVTPDPDAAKHRRVLLEELDACEASESGNGEPAVAGKLAEGIETARSVLRAAGNLGFLSADLMRRDGEGVVDAFVALAALANAIGSGDEPAALKAAEELVDIVSDLCGDEAASAIANGIAPAAGEAEPDAGPAIPAEDATAAGEAMAS